MRESILESMREKGGAVELSCRNVQRSFIPLYMYQACRTTGLALQQRWLQPIPSPPVASLMPRQESMFEHVVGHAVALCDPLGRVERPVDAKVNAALRVLFLCL
jgi:hypothetical protein